MKYIVSLVDHAKDLELLNIAARNMFTRAMLAKQEIICGLEDKMDVHELIALSYNANESLHRSIGMVAMAYSQPMTLTIDDDGGAVGFDTIEYSVTVGQMAFTMMRDHALKILINGGDDEEGDKSNQRIFGTEEAKKEFEDILDEFLVVVKAVFTKQTDEFIEHVKKTSSFSAKVFDDNAFGDIADGDEVVVTMF